MPALELTLLSVIISEPSETEQRLAAVKPILRRAKLAMENHSKRPNAFRYLQSTTSPGKIYVLGEWDSVEDHVRNFVPGDENQRHLKELEGKATLEWIGHFDVPLAKLVEGPLKKRSMVIYRWFLETTKGEPEEVENSLKAFADDKGTEVGSTVVVGWRVDETKAEYLNPVERGIQVFVIFIHSTEGIDERFADLKGPGVLADRDVVEALNLD